MNPIDMCRQLNLLIIPGTFSLFDHNSPPGLAQFNYFSYVLFFISLFIASINFLRHLTHVFLTFNRDVASLGSYGSVFADWSLF